MSGALFIDVSHTANHPFNTGVQRVVRELSARARHWPEATLIRFDAPTGKFRVLSEEEIERLVDNRSDTGPLGGGGRRTGLRGWINNLLRQLRIFEPLARMKDALTTPFRYLSGVLSMDKAVQDLPFGGEGVYLTAEVFGEPERVRVLRHWFKTREVRVMLVVHDLIPYYHPEWSIMKVQDFSRYLSLFAHAWGLSADSDHTLAQVSTWFARTGRPMPARSRRIYPGFDLSPVQSRPEALGEATRFFACIGTIEPRKNQLGLLAALETLWQEGRDFMFVFVGREAEGYTAFHTEWRRLTDAGYPLRWLNSASDPEIQWLYGHAEATVYPSLCEGYGLPIVESLARKTPCVASSRTSTGEIAREFGGCLIVDPEDPALWAVAMARFLDEPTLRASLAGEIRRDRLRSWDDYAADIAGFIRSDE